MELRINKYLRVDLEEYKQILTKLFTNYQGKISGKAVTRILEQLRVVLAFLQKNKLQISHSKLLLGFDRKKGRPLLFFNDFEHFQQS